MKSYNTPVLYLVRQLIEPNVWISVEKQKFAFSLEE